MSAFGADPAPAAWIRAAEAVRMVELEESGVSLDGSRSILTPLVERNEPREVQDRTCDRCGEFVPPSLTLTTFLWRPVRHVGLVGALCGACATAQGYVAPAEGDE
jgi:hypothetical protein